MQYPVKHANENRENLRKALAHYQTICDQQPDNIEAWLRLAGINAELGKMEVVESCCRQAIMLQTDNIAARYNLGVALQQQGKAETAISCYRELLEMQPDHAAAHANLGLLYHETKNPARAEALTSKAILLQPDKLIAHNTLGLIKLDQERYQEAINCFQKATRLDPGYAQGHYNLGLTQLRSGKPIVAAEYFQQALQLEPDNPDTLNDLGSAFKAMGNHKQALENYTRAIQVNSDHAEAHWNRSLALLLTSNYTEGWTEYEWRWKSANRQPRKLAGPAWQGESLSGRRIFLYTEQGLGDSIQFIRYAQQLKERGATVIVELPSELSRVFATCRGIDQIINQGEPLPIFDFHSPLMSLPGLLNTREGTIPSDIPYLSPPDDRKVTLSRIFDRGSPSLKVGIVWAGSPKHTNDSNRFCQAQNFLVISNLQSVQLYSLQKGGRVPELSSVEPAGSIIDLSGHLEDFADTAQALGKLDLLITVDTSVAHLAGAMGTPVWVLLPYVPDWRWQLHRDDSPWYPSMRLFRQQQPGGWIAVFEQVKKALIAFAEYGKTGIIY